ncbi:rhamnosyltransferase [Limnohabitans sp. MORI2]|nr:rhamnosyltransferase [Limnohabitans sp. MORI2]
MDIIEQQMVELKVLIVDSDSTDGTNFSSLPDGWNCLRIAKCDFNHGNTRNWTLQLLHDTAEIVVFMTQDALLVSPDTLKTLLDAFSDPEVACAYGRQLPHDNATPLAAHARNFNYPNTSRKISMVDQPQLGLKTCFFSNSFAAYRLADLQAVGGFPSDVILGEDMSAAARLLMAGKRVAYIAEACVQHSHNYTLMQEFRRYFDTGIFHARSPWILKAFGEAGGEGLRFVSSELNFLWRHAPGWIPNAMVRSIAKWLGYKLGRQDSHLPLKVKRWCSMHRGYWS